MVYARISEKRLAGSIFEAGKALFYEILRYRQKIRG
jgi:hypothetical protein